MVYEQMDVHSLFAKKDRSLKIFVSGPADCNSSCWGFHAEDTGTRLSISPTLRIVNNTNVSHTLKNFRLLLVSNRMIVTQINWHDLGGTSLPLTFGNNDPHSVTVPLNGGEQEITLHFTCTAPSPAPHFDTLVLRYEDQNAQPHDLLLARCEGNWNEGVFQCPQVAVQLPSYALSLSNCSDDKRLFMQLIQEPISRMSTISTIFKGLAAAIVAGISALDYDNLDPLVLGLSFVPIIAFALLDMYYLRLERGFRYLYTQVRLDRHPIDFNILPFPNRIDKDPILSKAAKIRYRDLISARCIWLFYLPLIAIAIIVLYLKYRGIL